MSDHFPQTEEQLLALDDSAFVEGCYHLYLGRAPDPEGTLHHLASMRSGVSKQALINNFVSSPEGLAYSSSRESELPKSENYHAVIARTTADWKAPFPIQSSEFITPDFIKQGKKEAINRLIRMSEPPIPISDPDSSNPPFQTLWIDMTTAFEWTGGVVGIVRAELEIACGLKQIDRAVRFSVQIGNGFAEISSDELRWLLEADNVADAYIQFFGRQSHNPTVPQSIHVNVPDREGFFHPYDHNDVILSVGWMDSQKEGYFSRLKARMPSICIGYLIYDIILLRDDTAHFYDRNGCDRFRKYIKWISCNADFVLFGGETAKKDTEALQVREGWPVLPGRAVQFGTDIAKSIDATAVSQNLRKLGVTAPFIMTVGSLEPRKNHDTLYRAYLLVLEQLGDAAPQLVIIGKPMWRVNDLIDTLKRDPRLVGKVIMCTPTDEQLAALYSRCEFTLLPSIYEGWSLTLPESLGQGKYCLCCNTPPLREIGKSLVDYVDRFDVRGWADKIIELSTDPSVLSQKSQRIIEEWPTTRWKDTAQTVIDAIYMMTADIRKHPKHVKTGAQPSSELPTIWLDISLTYLQWGGGVNGIIRAELTFAYFLHKLAPNTRFFAYDRGAFFEVSHGHLSWLFDANDLSVAYKGFHDFWHRYESAGSGSRNPLVMTGHPTLNDAYIASFPKNSILLFVGIDSDGSGKLYRNREVMDLIAPGSRITTSQLIYDFTPILTPQFHAEPTCNGYKPFVDFVSNHFDHLIYGGRTAQRDGIAYQKSLGLRSPPSDFIEFGSNLDLRGLVETTDQGEDNAILHALGLTGDFVITVGTIEPRKNHEMLYKAYLRLMETDALINPLQLVFVGKPGWKSDDFLANLNNDERIKGKVIILTPSDHELATLYRQCRFTLLPSFYEGWSLPLPESLSYGKFCLTSNVDPLRETAGDLVEYLHPLDTHLWADRISYYANNPQDVARWEAKIRESWRATSWETSTANLLNILYAAHRALT